MRTIRLGLEWFLNPDHVPLLVAQEHGWFKDEGLELEVIEPEEHLDAMEAIEADQMDVAITEPIHLVEDVAKGQAAVGFCRFLHTNGGVMVAARSGIERPRDMAGCRIQYPGAPGPGGKAIVASMIAADGGVPDLDALTPVNNSFYHTDALLEDKADVATLVFTNFELVEAAHRGLETRFFALKDWGIPDFCQLILITNPDKLRAERDTFTRLIRVIRRGIDFLHTHPEEARAIYNRRTGGDPDDALGRAIFDATLPCFTYDFSMSREYYERLEAWMSEQGLIADRPGAERYWTNDLAF